MCETMTPYHIIWFQLMSSTRMSLEFVSNMSFNFIWVVSFCDANMFSFLFWGKKHGKQSGAACTSGFRCSCALFNVITHLHELLFSFSIYFFFNCLFVFESCYSILFLHMSREEAIFIIIHTRCIITLFHCNRCTI